MAFLPLLKGVVFGAAGGVLGGGLAMLIRTLMGLEPWSMEPVFALGYTVGLLGWLMGIGLWSAWGREWFGLSTTHPPTTGWGRYFQYNLDHKVIGVQYLVTFVVMFLAAGLLAMVIRWELMSAGPTVPGLTANTFNNVMSSHGIMMVAVAVASIMGGFGNYMVPLMIGAEDFAFPRVNALSYWIVPPVALLLVGSVYFGGFDAGWTAYPPMSEVNGTGQLCFLLAFLTFGLSSILGGLNFISTIAMLRAPGMTWGRLPIFVWSVFAAAIISLTGTQFVAAALLMVILDRTVGMSFFRPAEGGAPLLYQHIFWFYSHPAVYIMILPGFGLALELLSHFSRKPLFAYKWVVGSFLSVVALGFVVWAHHLFTSGMADYLHIPIMITTELISIPTGMVFLSALGTIWMGSLWLKTPMLFALGFVANFLIGGITGIFLADVPTDIHLQDTYFVVAHFHYTIVGGEIFALFGGIYYWFPKMTGRMYNESLGKLHFWWMFVSYNLTFTTMFQAGLLGMNRRVYDFLTTTPNLAQVNMAVSLFAFALGLSFLVFTYNMVASWIRGPKASDSPWSARTLEWHTSSPPPVENFLTPPVVKEGPYDYGTPPARPLRRAPAPAPALAGHAGDRR